MAKTFRGTCVENPFGSSKRLSIVIDNGREITKETFLKNVDLNGLPTIYGHPLKRMMRQFPYDFRYYSFKGKIYFFTHSCIEHFFW